MAWIVVIGSVARDEVIRLVEPLRPGAHLNGIPGGSRLGGGGANTAVTLAGAGHRVTLLASVGEDAAGDWLLTELQSCGVDTSGVARVARPTTHSLVFVDPLGERTIANLGRCEEADPPYRLRDLAADAVFVRSRRDDLGSLLAEQAEKSLVVAHVPPVDVGSRPAQVIVASRSDLGEAATGDLWALGRRVAGERLRWFVLTTGADGARAISCDDALDADAAHVATVDTTGAGDAFAAGLVHGLVSGYAMPDALAMAVRFGTEATLWPTSALPAAAVQRLLK
ncbi:MAG: carbohydrate kinase [Betaproteobacteria bacterium]|nr:carbohydrate kinase [Betaproteobacteria bacterium]